MRTLLAILIALTSLATARSQPTLYVLGWSSPFPVHIERVTVTGGALVQVLTVSDGLSGTIAASGERECVTIAAEGQTTAGVVVRWLRTWDAACDRLWLPLTQKPPAARPEARGQVVGAWG